MIKQITDATPVLDGLALLLMLIGIIATGIGFAWLQQKRSDK